MVTLLLHHLENGAVYRFLQVSQGATVRDDDTEQDVEHGPQRGTGVLPAMHDRAIPGGRAQPHGR